MKEERLLERGRVLEEGRYYYTVDKNCLVNTAYCDCPLITYSVILHVAIKNVSWTEASKW